MVILETERLVLRQWEMNDFEDFAAMSAEPEVMQFIAADGKPLSRFGAWQGVCANLGHWQLSGFGMFAIIEGSSGQFAGSVGPWHPDGWPGFEIGWTLLSKFWGRGYATRPEQLATVAAHLFPNPQSLIPNP